MNTSEEQITEQEQEVLTSDELKYHSLFGRIGVDIEQKNKVRRILLNATCPSLSIPCVGHNNILLVGLQGTGKTQLICFIIQLVLSLFPGANILFTNSMQYNIDHLANTFYNLAITDDAVELQDSYRGIKSESVELSHDFFNIRHIIEDRFRLRQGYVLTVWGVQMYKALQKRLRQAPITIFTSVFNDKEENKFLYETLGEYYYKFLRIKSKYIWLLNRYEYNCFAVLKALDETFYLNFDMPTLQMKKKSVNPKQQEDIDIKIINQLLLKKMKKSQIYEALDYIYSKDKKERGHITDTERNYIKIFYKSGINTSLLAELFHRDNKTIFSSVHPQAKSDKQYTIK